MRKLSVTSIVLAASIFALALNATLAVAIDDITNSKHNFSPSTGTNSQFIGSIDEVCKYCHTPHNAGSTNFLWNKANSLTQTYKMYTSSRTLTRATATGTFTADSPSLLCLGCHDGKTAMNVLHSTRAAGVDAGGDFAPGATRISRSGAYDDTAVLMQNTIIYDGITGDPIGSVGANIGDDLSNDHPVGFSYKAAVEQSTAGKLFTVDEVGTNSSNKIRFFGTDQRLECSSCHNPHRKADAVKNYFLAMDNNGSALCLSCHNK